MAKVFSFEVKDKGKVFKNILKRDRVYLRDVRMQLAQGGDEFIRIIQSRWYSGRKADDTGLNRVTSRLHNGWRANVMGRGFADVHVSIINGTSYGEFHELGTSRLKKRTFVGEDIKGDVGKKIFVSKFRQALKKNF